MADNWEAWYPCPHCGSTKMKQIKEIRATVYASEDGSYRGEDAEGEYSTIECAECGEILREA